MKVNNSYEMGGIRFTVSAVKNGLYKCNVIGRYEVFYIPVDEGNSKLISAQITEVTS